MPVDLKNYPADWKQIALNKKNSTGWKCELCPAEHKKPHWKTGSRVIITVHHIDSNKMNNSKHNLLACCQRCHLRLDLEKHIKNRLARRGGYQERLGI